MPVNVRLVYTRSNLKHGTTSSLKFDANIGPWFDPEVAPWSKQRIERANEMIAKWNRAAPDTYSYVLSVEFIGIGAGHAPVWVQDASVHQIDFLCLTALGLTPYVVCRHGTSYIPAGKRTHYKYVPCTNPKQAMALQELASIGVEHQPSDDSDKPWLALTPGRQHAARGATPSEAIARVFVVKHFGSSAYVPSILA